MECKKIIEKLCSFGERQFENEVLAREFIVSLLKEENIDFTLFSFETFVPKFKKSSLVINENEEISCLPTGFVSGKINNNFNLISSLTSSQDFLYKKNINFNPLCKSISRANFYFNTSFAVNFEDIPKICRAKKIDGELEVEKSLHETKSILVGNLKNPKNIIFSHFDSVEQGAIDNASGVAVCLSLIFENKKILEESLFVFDSNEELSYDEPIYWGHGYREFEKEYFDLLLNCENVFVVDCVAYSQTHVIDDKNILKLAFPIRFLDKFDYKVKLFSGDYDKLMEVYQSPIDDSQLIDEIYIEECKMKILSFFVFGEKIII